MLIYPAIFTDEGKDGYSVQFPDVDGCLTEGKNLEHAAKMAVEALDGVIATMIDMGLSVPVASDAKDIKLESDKEHLVMICSTADRFMKKERNKAVKKTLSIPAWLNDEAEKHHINYSSVLQEALKEALGV